MSAYPVSYGPTAEAVQDVIETGDAILVAIDFELLCKERLQPNGTRAQPITEIGLTTLDLRTLRENHRAGGAVVRAPGDRGIDWMSLCRSSHVINDMYSDHGPETCRMRFSHTNPNNFVHGKSKFIRDKDIGDYLNHRFDEIRGSNRTNEERRKGKLRDIVLLTWASPMEERVLEFLQVGEVIDGIFRNMFRVDGVRPWDIQKHEYINRHFGTSGTDGKKAEAAIDSLGILIRPDLGKVHHNAGNDAAYVMKMFLALANLSNEQVEAYCERLESLEMMAS
ncbi:hypothetical protein PT974_05647 [Cladobotryum mycophilum]|uniref:Gfd2/YDR514C-like C-terminal domain-containing protein n=1 Tax=Cladobotryum mycophilum TaxID=491253 RepID=A0ABR0SJB3_9HYPO